MMSNDNPFYGETRESIERDGKKKVFDDIEKANINDITSDLPMVISKYEFRELKKKHLKEDDG